MRSLGSQLLGRDPRPQGVLAELVGISRQQLNALRSGKAEPSTRTRRAMRDVLGIPTDAWDEPATTAAA